MLVYGVCILKTDWTQRRRRQSPGMTQRDATHGRCAAAVRCASANKTGVLVTCLLFSWFCYLLTMRTRRQPSSESRPHTREHVICIKIQHRRARMSSVSYVMQFGYELACSSKRVRAVRCSVLDRHVTSCGGICLYHSCDKCDKTHTHIHPQTHTHIQRQAPVRGVLVRRQLRFN